MLTKVIRPDRSAVTFTYDALGRRLSKRYKNTITKFVWDDDLLLHEWKENALTGEKLSEITIGDNGLVTWLFDNESFVPAGKIKGEKQYSIVTDHLGTPFQIYKEDGDLTWECELDSYGKLRMEKGEFGSCPFRYLGQYEDSETGLYYNRYRYYSQEDGIYISQDPIGVEGGIKQYSYVCDTTTWVDEKGLVAYDRIKIRKSTRIKIENKARTRGKGKSKRFLDPNTGKPIPGGYRRPFSRAKGEYDIGHKPGHEHWRAVQKAKRGRWSRRKWIEYNNDPKHYQIEDPMENQGHSHEKP